MSALPNAITPEQEFLAGVCDRLDQQNELLAGIRDQLAASPQAQPVTAPAADAVGEGGTGQDGGVVELKEPAPPRRAKPAAKPAPRKTAASTKTTTTATGGRGRAGATKEKS